MCPETSCSHQFMLAPSVNPDDDGKEDGSGEKAS